MASHSLQTKTKTETVAFGYRARALVLEQRIQEDLWLSATCAVINGGRRVSQTKSPARIFVPDLLTDVQFSLGNRNLNTCEGKLVLWSRTSDQGAPLNSAKKARFPAPSLVDHSR